MEQKNADLVLDVGNTRTKLALFNEHGPVRWSATANNDIQAVKGFIGEWTLRGIVMGSVASNDDSFLVALGALAPLLVVSGNTPAPIESAYRTPLTLGADRLANVVGATRFLPGRTALVVDLGTCITYDVVSDKGQYLGGAISPGYSMRAKALHAFSARLPLVDDPGACPERMGVSTQESIASGLFHGVADELAGAVVAHGHQNPGMAVVLTGGDAPRFMGTLKNGIFAHPFLTLLGLHAILAHHRSLPRDPADGAASPELGTGTAG